jgi:molybdopterin converting factor subunit 1
MTREMDIRLFARLRELAGAEVATVSVPDGVSVAQLRATLDGTWPGEWASLARRSAIAVNGEYATDDQTINIGDEVALIPPVSGG